MTKNKDINITPSKGISIVIKNDFTPPPIKPKKKRKYKKRVNTDLLKMPTMPSYVNLLSEQRPTAMSTEMLVPPITH
jgi:hypothetical protein